MVGNFYGFKVDEGTIGKSSEITISLSFTAEYAENAEASENQSEDWNGLKTLRPLRTAFGAAAQTAVINHWIFRQCPKIDSAAYTIFGSTVDHKRFKYQTLFDTLLPRGTGSGVTYMHRSAMATINLIYGWRARIRLQPADGWVRDAILDHNHRILNRKGVKKRKEVAGKE